MREGVIFTYDEENSKHIEGIDIKILPVWKWLLKNKS